MEDNRGASLCALIYNGNLRRTYGFGTQRSEATLRVAQHFLFCFAKARHSRLAPSSRVNNRLHDQTLRGLTVVERSAVLNGILLGPPLTPLH